MGFFGKKKVFWKKAAGIKKGKKPKRGLKQRGAQGRNKNNFKNQKAPAQQNQFNKPAQSPAQSKPTAMSDGPVDDDIPF